MTRFLSNGIRAPDLGGPVPETMQSAAKESESEWGKSIKRLTQNLKGFKRLVKKTFPRRHILPVWEDDEAQWWRRRRRCSMEDWPPDVCALFESIQVEEEEEEDSEEGEALSESEADEVEEGGVDHPFQNSDPAKVTVAEVEVSPELKVYQSMMKKQGQKHPSVAKEESPKKQTEKFVADDHSSGCAERGLVQLLLWQSSGGEEKGITGEASRKATGMSRCVFEGGGNEPPVGCGRFEKSTDGGAGRDDRRRCEGCNRDATREGGGSGWRVTATVKPPSPEPPEPPDSYNRAEVGGGMPSTKTLEEGFSEREVDLQPPPEPPDLETATTMAAEPRAEMAATIVVVPVHCGCCVNEEKGRKASGRSALKTGCAVDPMGQAQSQDKKSSVFEGGVCVVVFMG